jgi:CBS domain-containing protein
MQLTELMNTSIVSVSPDATIAEAARRMAEAETGAAVVMEAEQLVGVISERDILRHVGAGRPTDDLVRDRMTRHVQTAATSTPFPEAMAMMVDGRFRHLPIVDGGRVVGLVSMRDLMAWTALRLRQGPLDGSDVDPAELLATIHRMRTGAA